MLQKLFNPEWQITSKSFLLSSFLIVFSPTAEISRLELEFEESLPRKTASIFKEGIGQESNGAANQEKQNFLPPVARSRLRLRPQEIWERDYSRVLIGRKGIYIPNRTFLVRFGGMSSDFGRA